MPFNSDPNQEHNLSSSEKPDVQSYLADINLRFKEKEIMEKAKERGFPYVNLSELAVNSDLLKIIHRRDAENLRLMPFMLLGKKLKIAAVKPESENVQSKVKELQVSGYEVELYMASSESVKDAQQAYYSSQYDEQESADIKIEELSIQSSEVEVVNMADLKPKIESAASERALILIQAGAVRLNASDIHLEPEENQAKIRFRIDGIMTDIMVVTKKTYEKLITQIKYYSHLKLNIKTMPQDGKYAFAVNQRQIDVRVSTLPVEHGETVVLRLLDPKRGFLSFDEIGFVGAALTWVKNAIKKPNGLILVTGPTGSGKTTTLYSMLNTLNTPEKKIITLEDPIEYHLTGISQSEIDSASGYDFISGFRAVLRQDPDVVMIGEIRDKETAEIAAQAALTGHIVLSTLHTNSALESIPRLRNIGLPPFMVGPSLNLIIAQRLVRRLCSCAKATVLGDAERAEISQILAKMIERKLPDLPVLPDTILSPIGCDVCSKTGYKGQMSIVEVIDIDLELKELILNNASGKELMAYAQKKGFISMKEDGILKVLKGQTSLSEVWRVTV